MKIFLMLVFLSPYLMFSCSTFFSRSNKESEQEAKEGFLINGIANGLADSTWIFLNIENKVVDSSLVVKNQFYLEGKVNGPIPGVLYIKGYEDFKIIWIENKEIAFEAEKGKFKVAKISNSEIQRQSDLLEASIQPIREKQDSIQEVWQGKDKKSNEENFSEARKTFNQLIEKEKEKTIEFIQNNPNSLVSVFVLDVYKTTWGKDKTQNLFEVLSEEIKNSSYGKAIADFISTNKEVKIGDIFIDFKQENPQGKQVKLSDFSGKVVLLEFWASWCGPCRKENPELVKTYQNYMDKGFEVLGVSLDLSKENWIKSAIALP